jgi:hypothetical protein
VAQQTAKVNVVRDLVPECRPGENPPCKERFYVQLYEPTSGSIDKRIGVGTIIDDDLDEEPPCGDC